MKIPVRVIKESERVTRLEHLSTVHRFLHTVIRRDHDATRVNKVVNHPSVSPFVRGSYDGYMDLTPVVRNPHNVLLMGDKGGTMFVFHQPGLYEGHTQALPEGRGKWSMGMMQACLHWMFTRTDAIEIAMKAPKGNVAVHAAIRALGGRYLFSRDDGWFLEGHPVGVDLFSLTIQDWMNTAGGLTERGEWFHNKFEEEVGRQLQKADPVYLRYVGAAMEMLLACQPYKGVVFYNRWASMVGYPQVRVITENPLVIDIGGTLVAIRDQDFWVMNCQSQHR